MTQAPTETRHKDEAAKAAGYEDPELVLRSIGNGHWPGANETAASILAHAQTLANDEAKGKALAEIEKLTTRCSVVHLNCIVEKIAAIAAPYRASDPVAEALEADTSPFNAEERMREPFKAFLEAAADCGEHGYLVSMRPDPHGDEWEQQLLILPAVSIVTPAALAKFRAFVEGDR